MYKITIYLFLFLILSVFQLKAQSLATQLTKAKLNIIRASVGFLATDITKFKNIKNRICNTCNDYPGLIAFADSNNMKGVKPLIIKWRGIKLDTSSIDEATKSLNEFKEKVISDISTGNNAYRKQAFNFEEFESSVIANVLKTDAKVTGQSEATGKTDNQLKSVPAGTDPSLINITNIAYLESVIILCLLVYLIVALKKKKNRRKKQIDIPDNNEQLIYELKEKIKSKELEIKEQDTIIDGLNIEIEKLKGYLDNAEKNIAPNEMENQTTLDSIIQNPIQPKQPERFYTKYADLIDGFSVAELVEEENNETIFEIRLQSLNKATFKVSENPAAQKYALTNADYFLQKTCVYDVVPFGKITTEKEGQLSLFGGKWEIIEPAKISFK